MNKTFLAIILVAGITLLLLPVKVSAHNGFNPCTIVPQLCEITLLPSGEPSVEPTATPTPEITVEPSDEVTPSDVPTDEVTPTISEEATPTATPAATTAPASGGDGKGDGLSDGRSSCPECTKAHPVPAAPPATGRGN